MKTFIKSGLIFAGLLLHAVVTQAQTYTISRYAIAGGGGNSAGGAYSLSSTIGQHDAGASMQGGNFSLSGGFWSLFAVVTPGAPALSISSSGTNAVLISWPVSTTGWTLQQKTDLSSATWITLSNTVNTVNGQNQVNISPPLGNRFYRLKFP